MLLSILIVSKRYGRFHVLSDFDEGKRSCRRKLERHNNRRKRKHVDKGGAAAKQHESLSQNDNSVIDVDDGKGISEHPKSYHHMVH